MTSSKTGNTITVGGAVHDWPDGWREALIDEAGAESSDFILSALTAWQQSTPLQPYTNNPLGMPFGRTTAPQLLTSRYALFRDMAAFRAAFVAFLDTDAAGNLRSALFGAEDLAPLYRAIHALNWPGNDTETDYPSQLLDMVSASVRTKLQTAAPADRKTAGTIGYTGAQNGNMRQLGDAFMRAAVAAQSGANALNNYRKA